MPSAENAPRLLGAAFLFVLVVSLVGGFMLDGAIGSATISDVLVNTSNNLTLKQFGILVELVAAFGIVVLAVLLYAVLHTQNKIIVLVALGCWLAEAITLAASKVGAFALIPLSQEFVKAGTPDSSYFQTLGDFLLNGLYWDGYWIHMWFYGLGGVLWFYLFYRSNYIPRIMAVWGMASISVGLIGTALLWIDVEVNFFLFIQIAVFELAIGLWLVIKGIEDGSEATATG